MWIIGRWSWASGYDASGGRYSKGLKLGVLHWLALLYVQFAAAYVGWGWSAEGGVHVAVPTHHD